MMSLLLLLQHQIRSAQGICQTMHSTRTLNQNSYLAEIWKKRASGVNNWKFCGAVISPPVMSLLLLLGAPHDGELRTLKISTRKSIYCSRKVDQFLKIDILTRSKPGALITLLRPPR